MTDSPYCSQLSIEAGEPLAGTATQTSVFLLLEYNGAWGEKALEESDVPAELKTRLKAFGKSNPQAKILLIRSTRSLIQPGIRFFVVRAGEDNRAGEENRAVYDFHVADYADLLELDIPAILAGDAAYDRYRREAPLYLVCTNGRRDRCCARFGVGVFNALLPGAGADPAYSVWQCSHIGGHRFAANLICLPSGLLYGRVRPEDSAVIAAADRAGRIHLPNLRGRMAYPQPAQAAEAALRDVLGEDRLEALRLTGLEDGLAGVSTAVFQTASGEHYRVQVTRQPGEQQIYESCTLDKTTAAAEYTFAIRKE